MASGPPSDVLPSITSSSARPNGSSPSTQIGRLTRGISKASEGTALPRLRLKVPCDFSGHALSSVNSPTREASLVSNRLQASSAPSLPSRNRPVGIAVIEAANADGPGVGHRSGRLPRQAPGKIVPAQHERAQSADERDRDPMVASIVLSAGIAVCLNVERISPHAHRRAFPRRPQGPKTFACPGARSEGN
jgi:hypothetical protein